MEALTIIKGLECIMMGAIMAFIILSLSRRALIKIGKIISPSWISIIHTPIVLIGYFYFFDNGLILIGFGIIALGALLDALDGKVARAVDHAIAKTLLPIDIVKEAIKKKRLDIVLKQAIAEKLKTGESKISISNWEFDLTPPKTKWQQLSYRGGSDLGKHIDPLCDKLAVIPIYIDIAIEQASNITDLSTSLSKALLIGIILISIIIAADTFGTLVRMFKQEWLKGPGATIAGKVKVLGQWIWLVLYEFVGRGWIDQNAYNAIFILDVALGIIVFFGVISVVSKMMPNKIPDKI